MWHQTLFTTCTCRFKFILFVTLTINAILFGQNFIGVYGNESVGLGNQFRLNSLESNTTNFNNSEDWEISMVFGGTYNDNISPDIYILSISRKFGKGYLYARFTPGIKQQFRLIEYQEIVTPDTTINNPLHTDITYRENFGFGLAYDLDENFTSGLSLRYFSQSVSGDEAVPVISVDSVSYIQTIDTESEKNFWTIDFGGSFNYEDRLNLAVSTFNLIRIEENGTDIFDNSYDRNKEKSAMVSIAYKAFDNFSFYGNYETSGRYLAGLNTNTNFFSGKLNLNMAVASTEADFKNPVFLPSVNYSISNLVFFTSVALFNKDVSNSYFEPQEIKSLLANKYSSNRVTAGMNIALSFNDNAFVKILDVDIPDELYPSLREKYINQPFAYIKVVNTGEENVLVKSSVKIDELNHTEIVTGPVNISARDTVLLPVNLVIPEEFHSSKRLIVNAGFEIFTENETPAETITKPVILNHDNAWDGKIFHLKYFVWQGTASQKKLANNILAKHRSQLKLADALKRKLLSAEILFNYLANELQYVSDPRTTAEYVQFAGETLEAKGGDCDDISVLYASLLESIGIETAFVDYKDEEINHVNILFNTEVEADYNESITSNDKKYIVRKNKNNKEEIWLPVEITALSDFNHAWEKGAEKFYSRAITELGLAKGKVFIVDMR